MEKALGFEVPVVPISAQKRVNIDLITQAIQEFFPIPERAQGEDPEMLVARSFDINKPGMEINKLVGGVIGGAIIQGKFKKGQDIEITPETLYWWFLGDGMRNSSGLVLCTESFTQEEVEFLTNSIVAFGLHCNITKSCNRIRIRSKSRNDFLKLIGKPRLECYKYKWGDNI